MKRIALLLTAVLLSAGCVTNVFNASDGQKVKAGGGLAMVSPVEIAPQPTPLVQPPSIIVVEAPNAPSARQIAPPAALIEEEPIEECPPCVCVECPPEPTTAKPTPAKTPVADCTMLDRAGLQTILDRGGYAGQYVFCRSLSEGGGLLVDVEFPAGRVALIHTSRKKEYTLLTRQGVPTLKVNNAMIADEKNGRSNAILSWLDCQLDNRAQ